MKDQYVGDINDYFKYSVLRALADVHTVSLLACWMLTAEDDRSDGGRIAYLGDAGRYRKIDPHLFDALKDLIGRGERSTRAIESLGLLPDAVFVRQRLEDGRLSRLEFFDSLWRDVRGRNVVFFDPDNGLSVSSVMHGRAGSRRYLYCSELTPLKDLNTAAVVYQHFPRVPRAPYVADQLNRLAGELPGSCTLAIYSSNVALLAATPNDQVKGFEAAFRLAAHRWGRPVQVTATAYPT